MPQRTQPTIPGFRRVPRTGVIYVMHRAGLNGYTAGDPAWANLGQGSPEVGELPGAPPRIDAITVNPSSRKYSDVPGHIALRQKVADFYNTLYRQGKSSQYSYENVSIAGGGRLALTRIAAALGDINMGHFLPDYTAYEELLTAFKAFIPIPILLNPEKNYKISEKSLQREILWRGLTAVLTSNPCNPTGQVIEGEELRRWIEIARDTSCTFIFDEFYSHYIYSGGADEPAKMVSAAAYIDDVEHDPVIIVDGLTKNWRYPGWRISWTLGPKSVIDTIASAGSFLDGGANHPFQHEALVLLDMDVALQETAAIQTAFRAKRDYMLERLAAMGISAEAPPQGAFYVWASLAGLPKPISDGLEFFREGLKEKVITVPGLFFDVNPGRRRSTARYHNYCRISFGPDMATVERGLDAIQRVIKRHS
ncbi:MAG: pyridoxal phosphate-dependent aminotransferase [Anaerolineae bacterium]|nr:pyridoxal phosphate-dependent aminotransferase [Anaerolineae bacterium]